LKYKILTRREFSKPAELTKDLIVAFLVPCVRNAQHEDLI